MAVVAGFVLAAEITVLAIPGSPDHVRAEIADAATSLSDWDLDPLVLFVAVAVALIAAYLVGHTARMLTFAVVSALVNAINLFKSKVLHWWHGGFVHGSPDESVSASRSGRRHWERLKSGLSGDADIGKRLKGRRVWATLRSLGITVGRSLWQPFVPYVMRPKDVWPSLDWTYGADTVNRMLERHPLKARVDVHALSSADRRERERAREAFELQVALANEYCQLWLQRYAAEVAITPRATRSMILGTAALPAVLLPQSLRRVGGDLDSIVSVIGPLQLLLLLGALVLVIGVLRESRGHAAATFHRFVVVELAGQARGRASDTTAADADPTPES